MKLEKLPKIWISHEVRTEVAGGATSLYQVGSELVPVHL